MSWVWWIQYNALLFNEVITQDILWKRDMCTFWYWQEIYSSFICFIWTLCKSRKYHHTMHRPISTQTLQSSNSFYSFFRFFHSLQLIIRFKKVRESSKDMISSDKLGSKKFALGTLWRTKTLSELNMLWIKKVCATNIVSIF